MAKICAIQMDPISSINYQGDSSFMIGLEAIRRGYDLFHYEVKNLTFNDGQLHAKGHFVLWQYREDFCTILQEATLNLNDVDLVFLRQDPPFDMNYITNTHLLEHVKARVVNNPKAVRNAPEKLSPLLVQDLMPKTMITRNHDDVLAFSKAHGDIIVKPLYGNGGVGVFKTHYQDVNMAALIEFFQERNNEPFMVQQFIPEVTEGDKRVLLIGGEVKGAINRRPLQGQVRSNMHVGGQAEATILSDKEQYICARLKDWLIKEDIVFCGIDIINGLLTEINITSPTGIQEAGRLGGSTIDKDIFDYIEQTTP